MNKLLLLLSLIGTINLPILGQSFTDSNLPIVILNTDNSQDIPDEPKIWADMKIIYRGEGQRNYLTDQNNEEYLDFDSRIKIEIRGSSSQDLPKKQYGFTTYTADGSDKDNVSLLGMPKENDWILSGIAYDSSLVRDYLCYNLSRQIGQYAPRTRYCELVLNGSYNGLYILLEKIKQDDNRVDVDEIAEDASELPALSGGYVTKADKVDESDPAAWSMASNSGPYADYIHVTPKPEDATDEQTQYIQSVFASLATTSRNGNDSKSNGYPSVIDIPSFIDFMLINELSSNVDAYQFSTYFHKDRNGKLRAGPIWDLNLTFDNDLRFWGLDRSFPDVWQFDNGDNVGSKFWLDLFEDDTYRCYLSKRWNELIADGQPLNQTVVETYMDEIVVEISEATVREEARWGTIVDHAEHITQIKDFLDTRYTWMTTELGGYAACADVTTPALVITKINYNPLDNSVSDNKLEEFIEITNGGTTDVDLTGIYFGGTGFVYQFPSGSILSAGQKISLANSQTTYKEKYKETAFGEYTRSLSNSGQTLSLLDAYGNPIDQVTYSDGDDWPDADGSGYYLELLDAGSDNNDPSNWTRTKDEEYVPVITASEIKEQLLLYPNPTSDQIMIISPYAINQIQLTDLNGRVLHRSTLLANTQISYDMSIYKAGVYFLEIRTEKGLLVERILRK